MKDDRNTAFGWILFSGVIALGASSISSMYFQADDPEMPEKPGYFIEAAEEEGAEESGPSLANLLAAGTASACEGIFAKCQACHTINQGGANGIGPNLWGVMGEPIGEGRGGYAFSSALSGHGGNWTFENMDAWLASPRKFAAGTKMSFAGLGKPEDRANLMAWLNTQGSNIALPPPPVEEPEEGDAPAQDNGEMGEQVGTDFDDATAVNQPDPELQDTPILSDQIPEE